MAIINSGDFPIDPTTTSGTDLAGRLNRQLDAIASNNANATRPVYITAGGLWTQTVTGGGYKLYFYDGSADRQIGAVSAAGVPEFGTIEPLALAFSTSTTYATGQFIYDPATVTYLEAKNNNGPGAYNAGDWDTVSDVLSKLARKSGDTISSATISGGTINNTVIGGSTPAAGTFTTLADAAGNVRSVPQNAKTAAYTLVASDNGKHISITTGGVTIPSGVFSIGDNVTIYNNSASSQTITQGASVTLRQVGTTNTGNRTLAAYGLATVLCVASNTFVITGGGVS